jgi:hypothetical protein
MEVAPVTDNSSDRRTHERIASQLVFEGYGGEQDAVARMVASNLSMGGVYCTSSNDFPEMTRLGVRMALPPNGNPGARKTLSLEVEAVVVRRRSLPSPTGGNPRFELALYFTSISEEQKQMLSNYLQATSQS